MRVSRAFGMEEREELAGAEREKERNGIQHCVMTWSDGKIQSELLFLSLSCIYICVVDSNDDVCTCVIRSLIFVCFFRIFATHMGPHAHKFTFINSLKIHVWSTVQTVNTLALALAPALFLSVCLRSALAVVLTFSLVCVLLSLVFFLC